MAAKTSVTGLKLSRRKKLIFAACTFLLTLAVIEAGARALEFGYFRFVRDIDEETPFVAIKRGEKLFEKDRVRGAEIYRRTKHVPWISRQSQFAVEKPDKSIRIFCLGGSAACGWPHGRMHTYPGMLERKLSMALPQCNPEVVNVAGFAFGSHRVRLVFDEIIDYQPDVVLIYSGNNEFLEQIVYDYAEPLPDPWNRLALARIAHRGLVVSPSKPVVDLMRFGSEDFTPQRLSFAFGKSSPIRQDSRQFELALAHYRYNIEWMVKECKRRNVPVMLLTVPVNLKDWIPNVSRHREDLTPEELSQWMSRFREGMMAMEAGEYEQAARALEHAIGIDDQHAESHYFLGVAKQKLGEIATAEREYIRALDEDRYPFRSPTQFQNILVEISDRHRIPLVDITRALEDVAQDGIIGLDVMIDYVHATAAANEVIADTVFHALQEADVLPETPAVPIAQTRMTIPADAEEKVSVLYPLFDQYIVMRQYDKLNDLTERILAACRTGPGKSEIAPFHEKMFHEVSMIQKIVEPYRKMLRAQKLGILTEEYSHEEADKIYENYAKLIHWRAGDKMSREKFSTFVPELEYH